MLVLEFKCPQPIAGVWLLTVKTNFILMVWLGCNNLQSSKHQKKNLHYLKDVSVFLHQHFMSIDRFSVCFKFPSKLNYYSNKAYNFIHYNSFVVTVRWRSVGSFDRKLLPIYVCIAFKGFIVQRTFRAQPNILRTKPLRHVDWRWWNSIHRKKKKKKKEAFQSRCHSRASKSCFFGSMIDLSGKRSLFVDEWKPKTKF